MICYAWFHAYRSREFTRTAKRGYDIGMSDYHVVDNMTSKIESKHEVVGGPRIDDPPSRSGRQRPKNPSKTVAHKPSKKPRKRMGREPRSKEDREVMRSVGERLRFAREELNLKQHEVAAMIGVDTSSWCSYEIGRRFPDPLRMPAICARLNVDISYVYFGKLDGVERTLAILLAARHPELVDIDRTSVRKHRTRRS